MKGLGTGTLHTDNAPKYARIERERRYLLRELPETVNRTQEHAQITDNYLTGTRLRLRKSRWVTKNEWTLKLTQKHTLGAPPDFTRSLITTIYLNRLEYETLSIFEGTNEIRKNRYYFMHDGRQFSVDVFLGDLLGLILAECEFETDEELDAYPLPPFALADVSREELFTGGRLVVLTADEIRAELKRRAEKAMMNAE